MRTPAPPAKTNGATTKATGANLPHSRESGLVAELLQPRLPALLPGDKSANGNGDHNKSTCDITRGLKPEDLEGMDMEAVRNGDDGSRILRWTSAEDNLLREAGTCVFVFVVSLIMNAAHHRNPLLN
jgi:hypothetical protein